MRRALLVSIVAALALGAASARAADRCRDYLVDVRIQHVRYLGPGFPWWYGCGQLKQESGCRADVTAFDHGMGIAQFMPATAKEINHRLGKGLDPFNPQQAIRMQAYYLSILHKGNIGSGALWLTYQAYNGGWTPLKAEAARARAIAWSAMRAQCLRKKIPLKGGRMLDLCEVNYDYSRRVHRYGDAYRQGRDLMGYW